MDAMAAAQISGSMQRLINQTSIQLARVEDQLMLNGCDVVDNGVNKAIINENVCARAHMCAPCTQVISDSAGVLPDWAVKVKLLGVFKQVGQV
jgi:hypothetical protein